ncbi:hypothetical protein PUN49_06625, partial [Pseudomonas extremaustralis]|uniref:hypothetical protein n=1 Tax=Pseudomonas extremaustralis TaxID=359110 RepID=UPI0024103DB6
ADKDWLIVVCFFMVSPSLSLAFYKNATVAHRRLGLGESIQLQAKKSGAPTKCTAKNAVKHSNNDSINQINPAAPVLGR